MEARVRNSSKLIADRARVVVTAVAAALIAASPLQSSAQAAAPAGSRPALQQTGSMESLIKALSGRWSLTVRLEPSKDAPNGIDGTGEESWHADRAGLTFTDEEAFHAGPLSATIVGILWRDGKTGDFHAMDCSKENPHTCDAKGAAEDVVVHWTGSALTVDEVEMSQGKKMISRIVWSDITAKTFTETAYFGEPGGEFQKGMTIHATRVESK